MSRDLSTGTMVMIFVATLIVSMAATAQAKDPDECSTARAAGNWGFTTTGTIILPTGAVPYAAVGRLTFDAEGNVNGTQSRSLNGSVAEETFTGTATMNADCTGTATIDHFQSGIKVRTTTLDFVFVGNMREGSRGFHIDRTPRWHTPPGYPDHRRQEIVCGRT